MTQVTIPTIKWGKRKQRSQMCELFTEDGRIVNVELEVLRGSMVENESKQGFIIDATNQFVNMDDKNWTQPIWERNCLPPSMINDSKVTDLNKLVSQVFIESKKTLKMEQFSKAMKNDMGQKIVWIVSFSCTAAVIIAGFRFLENL